MNKKGSGVKKHHQIAVKIGVGALALLILVVFGILFFSREAVTGKGIFDNIDVITLNGADDRVGDMFVDRVMSVVCSDDGTVDGERYCVGTRWVACSSVAGLACVNNHAYFCNQAAWNTAVGNQYCQPTDSWKVCSASNNGEIIDSLFVCNGASWISVACSNCAGNLPGVCIGSNVFSINGLTRTLEDRYAEKVAVAIACARETSSGASTDCVVRQDNGIVLSTPFDERVSITVGDQSGELICGNTNAWLMCTEDALFAPSDGGHWICNRGSWGECTADKAGQNQGNFVCGYDNTEQKWKWSSDFYCPEGWKYRTQEDDTQVCSGTQWLECPAAEELSSADVKVTCEPNGRLVNIMRDGVVIFREEQSGIIVEEINCHNDLDDDNDGSENCRDTDCRGVKMYNFGNDDTYSLNLRSDECESRKFGITTR